MSSDNEQQLVDAVQRGDRAALGRLLTLYQHRLFNIVLRMVRNRDDAAEVTQEAMLKVIEHIDDFQGKSRISTWMIRIAMNLAISHLRKKRPTLSLDGDAPDNGGGAAGTWDGHTRPRNPGARIADDREPGPLERVQQKEMIDYLHLAMDRIDVDFRGVLILRDIDQMDYQQMAEILGIPVGTVKSRLFRARLALRQEMFKLCEPGPRTGQTSGGVGDG